MTNLIFTWIFSALGLLLAGSIVPGFRIKGAMNAVVVAAVFGVLNALVGWLLFVIIGIGTLGLGFLFAFLTRWVVNALVLKLTSALSERIRIEGFVPALFGALVISLVTSLGTWIFR